MDRRKLLATSTVAFAGLAAGKVFAQDVQTWTTLAALRCNASKMFGAVPELRESVQSNNRPLLTTTQ
jgi:hypothetical protein